MRIGCVSFLNARPLIEGLDDDPAVDVRYAVPSALLARLEDGAVDVALCPVIDYQRSTAALTIVPAGGIGCDGPTLTVRLFSRVPWEQVDALAADTDSHTSIALAQVVLAERYGVRPRIVPRPTTTDDQPQTLLLIGDKVVTAEPSPQAYPHQLDLGEAWAAMTGRPFVFAVWMARADADARRVRAAATLLDACRRRNTQPDAIARIADQQGPAHGWPTDLARRYLGGLLRYETTERQLQAIDHFWQACRRIGLLDRPRPLDVLGCGG